MELRRRNHSSLKSAPSGADIFLYLGAPEHQEGHRSQCEIKHGES